MVRRIFSEYLSGKGSSTIAKDLMRDGVLTARGKPVWTSDSVRKILKNEKYMGHCLAQKTVTLDYLTHKRVKNRDHQPQFFVKNTHPAIISEEDWNAVQQEFKRRNHMLHDPDGKYRMGFSSVAPFSNKFFCGECGRPVVRRRLRTHSKDREKIYFSAWHCRVACKLDKEFKDCKSKYVWEEEIEKAFMKLLYDLKENKEKVIEDTNRAIDGCSLTEEEELRLEELSIQIERITNRISEMASREPSRNDSIYDATMRQLMYEQEILQIEYEGLDENKQEGIYLKNNLEEFLEYLDEINEPTDDFRTDIFLNTVEKGIIYDNHRVEFKFKCGTSYTTWAKRKRNK